MKTNNLFLLLLLVGTVYNPAMLGAQEATKQSEEAVPLLSPKQANVQMKALKGYLSKVKRCMVTGPCNQEELGQVKRHAFRLLKWMAVLAVAGLIAKVGLPAAQRRLAEIPRKVRFEAAVRKSPWGVPEGVRAELIVGEPERKVEVEKEAEALVAGEAGAAAVAEPQGEEAGVPAASEKLDPTGLGEGAFGF